MAITNKPKPKASPEKANRTTKVTADIDAREEVEKRAAHWRAYPNADTAVRIERALEQRMYLVNQKDISEERKVPVMQFAVLGSTGNVYDVEIAQQPGCTCPDSRSGHLC